MVSGLVARTCSRLAVLAGLLATPLAPALAITPDDARLLLARTGFAPTDQDVAALAAQPSRLAAVVSLLTGLDFTPKSSVSWMTDTADFPNEIAFEAYVASQDAHPSSDPVQRKLTFEANMDAQGHLFTSWWTGQMLATSSPLAERLVLFLHNHFVSLSNHPYQFWALQAQFRACGQTSQLSFVCLLGAVMQDPSILLYLNQTFSNATAPSANFARELLELFTLGIGNYTEQDVTETARALTGLSLGPDRQFRYKPQWHDNGVKMILGQQGNWGPADVQRIILAQPVVATLIVTKLWLEFVSPTPDPAAVARIAADLRADPRMALVPILGEVLLTDAFWAPANRGTLVKSPAEFVVGAMRQLGSQPVNPTDTAGAIATTGERLWQPPNVRGFRTGVNWINTHTLLARQGVAHTLASVWRSEVLTPQYGAAIPTLTPAQYVAWANKVMGDQPILAPPARTIDLAAAAEQILADPAYWLK